MRTYARIQSDMVAELLTTPGDISDLFHQHLLWVDVTALPEIQVGWRYNGDRFEPPAQADEPAPTSLAQLQRQLADLAEQLAALTRPNPDATH